MGLNTPSRYYITPADLQSLATVLQLGDGLTAALATSLATDKLRDAENWAESEASPYVGVPLKAIPDPGGVVGATAQNFPFQFILAIKYYALHLLLTSQFTQTLNNKLELAQQALEKAQEYMTSFCENPTRLVGAGRLKNPNAHFPPQLALPTPKNPNGFGFGAPT